MWARPAQTAGSAPGTLGWVNLAPTDPFLFFLGPGRAIPKCSGPGPHDCWPNPATMQINKAACRTRIRSTCSNLVTATANREGRGLNGGLAGLEGERPTWGRWLRLWQRWWPVAEEAKEDEENRRGCREERETDGDSWCSVGGCVSFLWWSW